MRWCHLVFENIDSTFKNPCAVFYLLAIPVWHACCSSFCVSPCPCPAIHGCYFCLLCPVFPVSKEDWDTWLDRLNQWFRLAPSHSYQLSPVPGYHLSLKAFLSGLLPMLTVHVWIQGLLLVLVWHRGERNVLAHPAAVHMLCQPVTLIVSPAIFCFLCPLPASSEHPWFTCHTPSHSPTEPCFWSLLCYDFSLLMF